MTPSKRSFDVLNEILRVLRLEGQAILDCAERTSKDPQSSERFRRAIEVLNTSLNSGGKIIVTGIGKSGKVGQKIAATLCSTGSLAVFLHPAEGLHGDLGLITKKDAVLALSHTGNTDEVVRLLPSLKNLSVPVIAICGSKNSRLAKETEVWIDTFVGQEACPHNLAPTTSTTLALAVGDALALALMQLRGFDAAAFAAFHPGGSLGNRLNLKVSDVMHRGEDVGTVSENASMDEVITISTQKKLGGVLVVSEKKLLGIITDGDIRRALKHKERFFEMKASEVMTVRPATITPQELARTALDLMENRPSQISVLPVVDTDGNWEGLVRVHDLAKQF
ncbi:MAG: hypothetical protein A2X97_10015 [Bdellovibrionales bacterium GWA1_52_35]|nr:MAG: hypothetical protein A2X97_10015 [Bdellovibrionales bacterium GWA1_52_35]HCM40565.1 KpsF/GutQ family sugar-phosphate isomerase [Bdellovibrionales bacterium]